MLAALRYPDDAHQKVQLCARMVTTACESGRYWVHPLQRPMHFYPKLRSQPWWDAAEFPWAQQLLDNYDEIRREVLKMRLPRPPLTPIDLPWPSLAFLGRCSRCASRQAQARRPNAGTRWTILVDRF